MNDLQPEDIKPLSLADRQMVAAYLERHPGELSEFTFTNLYAWHGKRQIYRSIVKEHLLFFIATGTGTPDKMVLFGPPFGPGPIEKILAAVRPRLSGATRVPHYLVVPLQDLGFTLRPDRDNADYLYARKDLAELAGRKYAKKRNHIKQCLQEYQCDYEPISTVNLEECLALQEEWCRLKGCFEEPGLEGEYHAILETFAHYEELPLIGGAIRLNGSIKAFALGERLNRTTAVWHFEKAHPHIPGLGQLINQWFAKFSLNDFELINREQDLGIAGLRQAKESYYPLRLVPKWTTLPPGYPPLRIYSPSEKVSSSLPC
ncbi:MAG: phosphatidylglycerol lysyltransferase domain-containing protein [Deltaproteobacteria bacterium]